MSKSIFVLSKRISAGVEYSMEVTVPDKPDEERFIIAYVNRYGRVNEVWSCPLSDEDLINMKSALTKEIQRTVGHE